VGPVRPSSRPRPPSMSTSTSHGLCLFLVFSVIFPQPRNAPGPYSIILLMDFPLSPVPGGRSAHPSTHVYPTLVPTPSPPTPKVFFQPLVYLVLGSPRDWYAPNESASGLPAQQWRRFQPGRRARCTHCGRTACAGHGPKLFSVRRQSSLLSLPAPAFVAHLSTSSPAGRSACFGALTVVDDHWFEVLPRVRGPPDDPTTLFPLRQPPPWPPE